MDFIKEVFAPVYDSGSCLGRELLDEKVDKMLNDNQMLQAYLNRDHCEVRWKNEKQTSSHFEIIRKIKNETKYTEIVESEIKRVENIFNKENLYKIIDEIDKNLPEQFENYRLPENRKELIKKFITLRFEKLRAIIQ
jgi:hypothetical protein